MVLEKTLESPLDSRVIKSVNPKGNQPWLFTGRTDAKAEAPMLATWCKQPIHWKILMLGKVEGRKRRQQRMRLLDGITDSVDMNLSKLWEIVKNREAWHTAVHWVAKSWTQLGDWTTIVCLLSLPSSGFSVLMRNTLGIVKVAEAIVQEIFLPEYKIITNSVTTQTSQIQS